jgi:two-component system sensor histidine kinase/response regulator
MQSEHQARILVVDDNQINIDLLINMLARFGYETVAAENGVRALQVVEETPPDLILLDINMPKMDGYETCIRLKDNPATAEIPVIFISAMQDTSDVLRGFEVGGVDYIGKPFKYREVIARVNAHVALYKQKQHIQQMREKEQEQYALMDAMRSQFIGSATHDLKNPLFVIAGYTDMLESVPAIADDDNARRFIDAIKRGVDKMSHLVRDMLDLLQLETDINLHLEDVSLRDLLLDTLSDMQLRADTGQVTFNIELPDETISIRVDPYRMERVLDNLVSNAIKYTPEGGTVTVSSQVTDETICIIVEDTGLGIPEEALPTLFDPFERVKTGDHQDIEGTGLGLSIVKAIVEQHNGRIEVESDYGAGSTFRVILPRFDAPSGM